MPVRKIPKNHLHVTGGFAGRKNTRLVGYESPLEREYMLLLEFDPEVVSFEEQPVRISFLSEMGKKTPYVPDVLVHYHPPRPPELVEVKLAKDFKLKAKKFAPKFKAAQQHADERGWIFRKVSEKEIRGPYLQNLKFLREYRLVEPDLSMLERVLMAVGAARRSLTVAGLIDQVTTSDDEKLIAFPALWHLVVSGRLRLNLNKPITSETRLSLPKERP